MIKDIALYAVIAIGLSAVAGGWLVARDRRVIKDHSARVEKQAEKKDAKAQTARAAAAAKPDSVLSRYCRDCGQSGSVQIVETGNSVAK